MLPPAMLPDGPLVTQISPDKVRESRRWRDTTAPFTLSPEPGALLCCANLPGDWALYGVWACVTPQA
jgi:hypothetical protein